MFECTECGKTNLFFCALWNEWKVISTWTVVQRFEMKFLTAPKASASLWLLLLKTGRRLGVPGRVDRACSSFRPDVAPSVAAFPPRPPGADL